MKIRSLGAASGKARPWDADAPVFAAWRTKPAWLQTVNAAPKTVHLVGLGDVGMHTALGLVLAGRGVLGTVGLYDLNEAQLSRVEMELSQIAPPSGQPAMPVVKRLAEDELFDCDIFLFCATKSIPAVGSDVKDVRMAQFDANRRILARYAREAARRRYRGLFVVMSDPVDLLCMEALRSARAAAAEGRPLTTDQIAGCGLGVMHARACYFARRDPVCADYLREGRAFGPHGEGLVIANSTDPAGYRDDVSKALTRQVVSANMQVRQLGFKPYLAPAMSSGVLTLLSLIRGEYCYHASYLNGLYFGALIRQTPDGIQWEEDDLPPALYKRLEASYQHLEELIWD